MDITRMHNILVLGCGFCDVSTFVYDKVII